jgi:tRNA threonylcarbamoyladenosine biosynthesis protein TsaE
MYSTHVSHCEKETLAIGRKIGKELNPPIAVYLSGDLGAGKTILTRGIAEGLGLEDSSLVHSPTFSLVNEYHTPSAVIQHIDLYRLDTLQDQYSIGLDEILSTESIAIIEWAEKLLIPRNEGINIHIRHGKGDSRTIEIDGRRTRDARK